MNSLVAKAIQAYKPKDVNNDITTVLGIADTPTVIPGVEQLDVVVRPEPLAANHTARVSINPPRPFLSQMASKHPATIAMADIVKTKAFSSNEPRLDVPCPVCAQEATNLNRIYFWDTAGGAHTKHTEGSEVMCERCAEGKFERLRDIAHEVIIQRCFEDDIIEKLVPGSKDKTNSGSLFFAYRIEYRKQTIGGVVISIESQLQPNEKIRRDLMIHRFYLKRDIAESSIVFHILSLLQTDVVRFKVADVTISEDMPEAETILLQSVEGEDV